MKKVLVVLGIVFMFLFPIMNVNCEENIILDGNFNEIEEEVLLSPFINNNKGGSVFEADENVDYSKTVNGILFAAGNRLKISGYNEYGMYAGNDIEVDSIIANDLFIAGNTIRLLDTAMVNRDLYIAGNSVTIKSDVSGNMYVYANKLVLNDINIGGNLYTSASIIEYQGNVSIKGVLKYNEEASIVNKENVYASSTQTFESNIEDDEFDSDNYESIMLSMLSLIVIACVLNGLFPSIYKSINMSITVERFFKKIGVGLLLLIVVPIAAIIALCTIVGVGIGLLALAIYMIILCLAMLPSMAIVGSYIYTRLFNKKDNAFLSLIIGIIVVKLICLIPFVGGLLGFLLFLFGLGVIYELLFSKKETKVVIEEAKIEVPKIEEPKIEELKKEVKKKTTVKKTVTKKAKK